MTFSRAFGIAAQHFVRVLLHEADQGAVADDAGLDAFHQAGAQLAVGERAQHVDVGKDGAADDESCRQDSCLRAG